MPSCAIGIHDAMVATRALFQVPQSSDTEAELRRCIRDLLSLSSLPALWIKADAGQIADSLAQLAVSILDAEFACVLLREPKVEILRCHERSGAKPIDLARLRERYRPNAKFEIVDDTYGCLRATCVPLGRDRGSALITLSRRPAFPSDTEQMLLRVAANQAAIAIERWKSDAQLTEQTRALQRLNENERHYTRLRTSFSAPRRRAKFTKRVSMPFSAYCAANARRSFCSTTIR